MDEVEINLRSSREISPPTDLHQPAPGWGLRDAHTPVAEEKRHHCCISPQTPGAPALMEHSTYRGNLQSSGPLACRSPPPGLPRSWLSYLVHRSLFMTAN